MLGCLHSLLCLAEGGYLSAKGLILLSLQGLSKQAPRIMMWVIPSPRAEPNAPLPDEVLPPRS